MGTFIGRSPETQVFVRSSQLFTGDNTTTSFTLTDTPGVTDGKQLDVYVNQVYQDPFTSYSIVTSNNTINFIEAPSHPQSPATSNNILVVARNRQAVGVVALDDRSVTAAKLADDAITADKISGLEIDDDQLTTTGVSAGSYGAEDAIPVITVNSKGRVSNVQNVSVNIPVAFEAANALPTILLLSGM